MNADFQCHNAIHGTYRLRRTPTPDVRLNFKKTLATRGSRARRLGKAVVRSTSRRPQRQFAWNEPRLTIPQTATVHVAALAQDVRLSELGGRTIK